MLDKEEWDKNSLVSLFFFIFFSLIKNNFLKSLNYLIFLIKEIKKIIYTLILDSIQIIYTIYKI